MLEDLYRVRNSCSRYLEEKVEHQCHVRCCMWLEPTYSSQNEMICTCISSGVPSGGISRYQTHIVCEPVVFEGLHVLYSYCRFVSRMFFLDQNQIRF
jgi:hypothetical protein